MGAAVARRCIRLANGFVNAAVITLLVGLFCLGCYAIWDAHDLTEQASSTNWRPYKPVEPEPLSFWELQGINPEVVAWLTVYGTGIDYPVCQSADEWKYLTTNAKGEPSPSGSLFMDSTSSAEFSDFVTFVYGHHMEHDVMFGQVADFLDQDFFEKHRYGNLYAGGRNQGLEFFACLPADAYDTAVYRRQFGSSQDRLDWLAEVRNRAACARNDVGVGPEDRVVALSTCSSDQTNGRTVLLAVVTEETFDDPFSTWPNTGTGVDAARGPLGVSWIGWAAAALAVVLVVAIAILGRRRSVRAGAIGSADGGGNGERT